MNAPHENEHMDLGENGPDSVLPEGDDPYTAREIALFPIPVRMQLGSQRTGLATNWTITPEQGPQAPLLFRSPPTRTARRDRGSRPWRPPDRFGA